jgi:hypothetical protein
MDALHQASQMNFWVTVLVGAGVVALAPVLNRSIPTSSRFLLQAFTAWCLAWFAWAATWFSLAYFPPRSIQLITVMTDLRAVITLIMYFLITRADSIPLWQVVVRGMVLMLVLAARYGTLFVVFSPGLASRLHELWSMSLGVISPIAVGWAIHLRFRSNFALVIGFAYGFMQPTAYEAAYHGYEHTDDLEGLANSLILLALMKVVWASVVTRYFLADPATTSSLVKTSSPIHELKFFSDVPKGYYLLTLGLLLGSGCTYLILKPIPLTTFALIVGILAALVAIVKNGLDLWDRYAKFKAGLQPQPPRL